jgi:tetratricopeptide (TPR) repeat protein
MYSRLFASLVVLMLCGLVMFGCAKKTTSQLDEGLGLYRQNKLEEARPFLEGAVQQDQQNPDAHAWLAETYRRLQQTDRAIGSARQALELDPCHSFAHTVLAWAYNPLYGSWEEASEDTAWHHLLQAAECDSTDGNIWIGIWVEAIRRGELDLEKKALRLFMETEFFTPALLAYNRWMLRHLPKNALLVTNGDMDTYPAVALQGVEHFRTDVVVVNRSLLNTTWYARYLRDGYKVPLPFEDAELDGLKARQGEDGKLILVADQILKGWLDQRAKSAFPRPIAISVTVGNLSFAEDTRDHLKLAGPFFSWLPVPVESPQDTAMLRASLALLDPSDFSGPLVSPQDRSPVRMAHTNKIVANVTAAALRYSQVLIDSGRESEALEMLSWAQKFESKTEMEPSFTEHIAGLRKVAQEKMP